MRTNTNYINLKCLPPYWCEPHLVPIKETKKALVNYILDNTSPTDYPSFNDCPFDFERWLMRRRWDFLATICHFIYGNVKDGKWEKAIDHGSQYIYFTAYKDEHIKTYDLW